MTMYTCDFCRCQFDDPAVRDWREDMDSEGHFEHARQRVCPYCGSPYFEEDENRDE